VYHSVPDRDEVERFEIAARLRQRDERRSERGLVIGRAAVVPDALDDPVGELPSRIRFDDRIFQ
jgi:hypothetical protein